MKILELHLQAYGPFTERRLALGAGREGLHLIYGPNEAGKSSALRALRALLYGVPERTQDDFRHAKAELRVGARLRGADGEVLRCYRRKGRKNTLLDVAGDPIAEERLQQLLGGVTEPLFERLFGIDYPTLVSGGQALLDERGREAEALFGSGLGSTSVHSVLVRLEQEAQSLFAPRASKPALNSSLSRLSELEREQRELSLSARHWEEARKAVLESARQLEAIDSELAAAGRQRHRLERIRRSLPGLASRQHLRHRLAELGPVPALDEDFGERHDQALTRRRVGLDAASKADARLKGLRDDAAGLEVSEVLLAEAEAIDALRDRLGSYLKASRDRPGLVAKRATLIEQGRQRLAEIRSGLRLEDVEALRPMLGRRRRATELGGRQEALESALKLAAASREAIADKLASKREQLWGLPAAVDYSALQGAIDAARRAGDLDNTIVQAKARATQHRAACQRELDALGLWQGSLAELGRLALPSGETLRRYGEAFEALDDERRRLDERVGELQKEQRQLESTLLALRLSGEVPSEQELEQLRERRDLGWRLLKRQWLEHADVAAESRTFAGELSLPAAFEQSIANADVVADRLRRESHRVHEQAGTQAKLVQCRQQQADTASAGQRVEQERAALEASWAALWAQIEIDPLPPREMLDWSEKLLRLREKLQQGDEQYAALEALQGSRDELRTSLISASAALDQLLAAATASPATAALAATVAEGQPAALAELRPVLQQAEACLSALERAAALRTSLEQAVSELEDAQRQADRDLAGAQSELERWRADWGRLMRELELEGQATPAEVSDYLESIAAGLLLLDEARKLEIQIAAIDQEAAAFEHSVQTLMDRLAPDLARRPLEEAMLQLSARLTSQREAKSRRDELDKQAQQAEAEIREAHAAIAAAEKELASLCAQAQCANVDELEPVGQRVLEHRGLTSRLRDVETELIEAGDGLSLEALAAEAKDVDRDAVLAELQALELRISRELNPKREGLFEKKLNAESAFQAMAGSDEAAALAEEVQQTVAELRAQADRYVRLRLAARVLRDQIEAFRRKHRDPILSQAARYFNKLTCASFSGVDTDFDDADQPVLVGVRPNAERLRVEAMSTGTRDQLYLALRLATLERYVQSAEPLPLIVDDILIQFDDGRARATLDALANFSAKTQVILFTHHQRVVDEAQGLDGASERVFVHSLAEQ